MLTPTQISYIVCSPQLLTHLKVSERCLLSYPFWRVSSRKNAHLYHVVFWNNNWTTASQILHRIYSRHDMFYFRRFIFCFMPNPLVYNCANWTEKASFWPQQPSVLMETVMSPRCHYLLQFSISQLFNFPDKKKNPGSSSGLMASG